MSSKKGKNKKSTNKPSGKKQVEKKDNIIKEDKVNTENKKEVSTRVEKKTKSKAEELVFEEKNKDTKKKNVSKEKENNPEITKEDKKTKNKAEELTFKENSDNKKKDESKVVSEKMKVKKETSPKKEEKNQATQKKENKKENIKTEEEKNNNRRKIMFRVILIITILSILLIFSTIFAIIGTFKDTIARGVEINGVDVSNLTYDEAKEKLADAMKIKLLPDIEIIYNDYKYTLDLENIDYKYNITKALEEAYNIGKSGNIIQNNFGLLKSALLGEKIDIVGTYDKEALDAIIDIIDTNIPGRVKQYSYYIEGNNLIITPGTDGVQVDTNKLYNLIVSSVENRNYEQVMDNYKNVTLEIPYSNVVADKIDAKKVSETVFTEPKDAYYVPEGDNQEFQIYPAVDGISFAISIEEAQKLIDSEVKTEYVIPLTITKAAIQLKDIGMEAFPYKIETFSTRYDASNINRTKNLEIATNKINGTVLMPGDVFSFNGVVGERTVAEGYENAKIYSNGQVVDGLAGGICQISSTLYNVALLSNLEIVERYNHSFTTSYVAAGRDATVVYGIKDFKFKNNRNYPIKIEGVIGTGIVTFNIYGMQEENEYDVKIIPVTTQTMPYSTKTIVDNTLAPGTMKVTQSGASGCKVTTYKELYLDNVLTSREVISNDVYQIMTRIIRVGPTPVETTTPETGNTVITQ